jgi:hypothetical protein
MKVSTTMGGVRVERDEHRSVIRCRGCRRTETATRVEITPPIGIGRSIAWLLMPNGWWASSPVMDASGTTDRPAGAQCPDCLKLQEPIHVAPVQEALDAQPPQPRVDDVAQTIQVELPDNVADSSQVKRQDFASARQDLSTGPAQDEERRRLEGMMAKIEERERETRKTFEPVSEILAALPPVMRPVLRAFMGLRHHAQQGARIRVRLAAGSLRSALWALDRDELPGIMEAAARLDETEADAITPAFVDALEPLLFDPSSHAKAKASLRLERSAPVTEYLRRTLEQALEALDQPRSLRLDIEARRMRLELETNVNALQAQHRILETALAIPPDALQPLLVSPVEAVRAWARATIDATEV